MNTLTIIFCLFIAVNVFAQTKDKTQVDTSRSWVKLDSIVKADKPLIVIDGTIYTCNFDDIRQSDILQTASLGNPGATNIYGERGKNGVLLITTLKEGKRYCQWKLAHFSMEYRIYLEANKNDDSGLVYLLNGVVLKGSQSGIIKELHDKIEDVQTVHFIKVLSDKLDTNNQKPLIVLTTNK